MMTMVRLMTATLLALTCFGVPGGRTQSACPDRVVKILVGFVPGSSADILARIHARKLADRFGQQFVIDNRAGAGGSLRSADGPGRQRPSAASHRQEQGPEFSGRRASVATSA